jgi:hypothetical protein
MILEYQPQCPVDYLKGPTDELNDEENCNAANELQNDISLGACEDQQQNMTRGSPQWNYSEQKNRPTKGQISLVSQIAAQGTK